MHEAPLLQSHGIINLELLGALYGLKAYCSTKCHLHIQLQIDKLWQWCKLIIWVKSSQNLVIDWLI